MAVTEGFVHRLAYTGANQTLCAWIGPSADDVELLLIQLEAVDPPHRRGCKQGIMKFLTLAHAKGAQVSAVHADNSALITSINSIDRDVSVVGTPIRGDFFAISGLGFPDDARIEFDSATSTVTVTPDLRRPHWLVIDRLPDAVPVGRNAVRVVGAGFASDTVPVDVVVRAPQVVRTLYSGRPATQPYTMVFVASPAIREEDGTLVADPVLTDRAGFHRTVVHCFDNLLNVTEDLLRDGGLERFIRFVTIFDASQGVADETALAQAYNPNIIGPRRDRLNAFIARYGEKADMVFVISGSTTHTRASAQLTTDDNGRAGTTFVYDGVNRVHRHYASTPGSCVIPLSVNTTGLTVIHEFGHGGSDNNNGRVLDLYVNGGTGFIVNKKFRGSSSDAVPANFAVYDGTTYASDPGRDGLGYPSSWTSYHPELIDASRPNLMDNYWMTAQPQRCRLDRLTREWFADRLRAKVFRNVEEDAGLA